MSNVDTTLLKKKADENMLKIKDAAASLFTAMLLEYLDDVPENHHIFVEIDRILVHIKDLSMPELVKDLEKTCERCKTKWRVEE